MGSITPAKGSARGHNEPPSCPTPASSAQPRRIKDTLVPLAKSLGRVGGSGAIGLLAGSCGFAATYKFSDRGGGSDYNFNLDGIEALFVVPFASMIGMGTAAALQGVRPVKLGLAAYWGASAVAAAITGAAMGLGTADGQTSAVQTQRVTTPSDE